MATSAEIMHCSLCLDEFKDPRALPCLHTFCLDCLVQLCASSQHHGKLKCPMCQEQHQIPQNSADGFRKDFRIKNFMEMSNAKAKEDSVPAAMCKYHPTLELTHFCQGVDCSSAALCTRCAELRHQNHLIHPIKSILKEKRSQLKMMKQIIQRNHELVQSAKMKVEDNKYEMLDKVKMGIQEYHSKLDELEKQITTEINNEASVTQAVLKVGEFCLQEAEGQLKALEAQFSDNIPHVLQVNADKQLDTEFHRLQDNLSYWHLRYSLLNVDIDGLVEFKKKNISLVDKAPEQVVKGAPVPMVPPVDAKEIVMWKQRDDDVRGVACHSYGGGGVTIVSSLYLRVYKQNDGEMFHSNEHQGHADGVTTFRERCHAVVDQKSDKVRLYYCWPIVLKENDCRIPHESVGFGISGTKNYLVYSTCSNSSPLIVCFSVAKKRPKFLWMYSFWKLTPRCLSALETRKQLLVVAAFNLDGKPETTPSLLAVKDPAELVWNISFETLDSEAEAFDLRDICNDGNYFYVLNAEGGCVYLVSVDGRVLSKILQDLQIPRGIACNSKTKDLVVAFNGGAVTVYKLIYKEQ